MGGKPSVIFDASKECGSLVVGSKKALSNKEFMSQFGAAVSMGKVAVDSAEHPSVERRLYIPIADDPAMAGAFRDRFAEIVKFIHTARGDKLNVYVHCAQGISRSASVIIAYLLAARHFQSVDDAMQWLCNIRPQASPNFGLLTALEEWDFCAEFLQKFSSDQCRTPPTEEQDDDRIHRIVTDQVRQTVTGRRRDQHLDILKDIAVAQARDLWLPRSIDRFTTSSLSPVAFARDYVGASKPVVFENIRTFDVSWASLLQRYGEKIVTVNATPDGRADAIVEKDDRLYFAKPEVRRMTLREFADHDEILYVSAQDDSLRSELPELLDDVKLPPAIVDAVNGHLAAVNLWMGHARSVTSAHRDRAFDNLYLVLDGEKTFFLLPPTAPAWLTERSCPPATWHWDNGCWTLHPDEDDDSPVDWIDADLSSEGGDHIVIPLKVVLGPGDLLFLPAGWVHEVHQADRTVAVNWWLDARFDNGRWAAADLAQAIGTLRRRNHRPV